MTSTTYTKYTAPEEYQFMFDIPYYRTANKTPMYKKLRLSYIHVSIQITASFSLLNSNFNEHLEIQVDTKKKSIKFKSRPKAILKY